MKRSALLIAGTLLFALAPEVMAGGRKPGSVLVYPIHRSGKDLMTGLVPPVVGQPPPVQAYDTVFFTAISVTNTNLKPANPFQQGGTTAIHFDYVNIVPAVKPEDVMCDIMDRPEMLTPADTLSVLTTCHNAGNDQAGYLVIHAQDPNEFDVPWSFNYLIGSEIVVTTSGGMYIINAIPFEAKLDEGLWTDLKDVPGQPPPQGQAGGETGDGDGELDFDGVEYEPMPAELYIDSFIALGGSSLVLANFTGGTGFTATVKIKLWNDNEVPQSTTLKFRCWMEKKLEDISVFFTEPYLDMNMASDPNELDIDCVGGQDLETGWAVIDALNVASDVEGQQGVGALLGAITAGPGGAGVPINGGHLLWEGEARDFTGDFLKFGGDDFEYPPPP